MEALTVNESVALEIGRLVISAHEGSIALRNAETKIADLQAQLAVYEAGIAKATAAIEGPKSTKLKSV